MTFADNFIHGYRCRYPNETSTNNLCWLSFFEKPRLDGLYKRCIVQDKWKDTGVEMGLPFDPCAEPQQPEAPHFLPCPCNVQFACLPYSQKLPQEHSLKKSEVVLRLSDSITS